MAKPASVNGEEIDLAGNKIQNLSLLKNVDRSKCRVLNLHNNMLSDLTDLPRFLFLTELNISSNRFTFIPDLSFLPALTILDVSGNTIESVVSLSFLPGLKSLKLAYNCLTSLHGINGANVPNLEYLDIRGNKITASEHEIKPIGSLLHLKEVSVTTTNLTSNRTSNRTSDLQIIALLFKTCSSLKFIDRKSQAIWREVALREKQSAKAAATAAAGMAAAQAASNNNNQHSSRGTALDEPVSTPLFDQVAAKFKHGLSSSPGSAEKGNSSSSASRSSTAAGTRTTATPRQGRGPPVYQHQQQQQAISPDVSFVDESMQVSASLGLAEGAEHQRLLQLQYVLATATARSDYNQRATLLRAFYRLQLYGHDRVHRAAAEGAALAHTEETVQLQREHTQLMQRATESHEQQVAALRHDATQASLKYAQLEGQLTAVRVELEAERDKSNLLKLSAADLKHSHTAQQEHDQRVIQDLQLALQTAQAAEQRLQDRQDIALRELESALSDSSATIEKLRMELALTKEQAALTDSRTASLQTAMGALQYEKNELYAKYVSLEQQASAVKSDVSAQVDALREQNTTLSSELAVKTKECEHWQQEHAATRSHSEKVETRLRQLHAAFEGLKDEHSALKTEHAELKESEKHSARNLLAMANNVKKLHKLLEMRDQNCNQCVEYAKQLESVRNDRAEDLRVCERVREMLRQSKEQLAEAQAEGKSSKEALAQLTVQHTEKTAELQSKLDALQSRYKQLELHAQAESARLELQAKLLLSGEENAVAQVVALAGQSGAHQSNSSSDSGSSGTNGNYKANGSPTNSPTKYPLVDNELTPVGKQHEKIAKLQGALQKKDAQLHELEDELHVLRERFHEQAAEYKACLRDCADLEKRHSHARHEHRESMSALEEQCAVLQGEVGRLQGEVARRSEVEDKLNAMVVDFMQQDEGSNGGGQTATATTELGEGLRKQLFMQGTSGDLRSVAGSESGSINGANHHHQHHVPHLHHQHHQHHTHTHTQAHTQALAQAGVCSNPQCVAERLALLSQVAERARELQEQKAQHDRLYLLKNEECARFAQALTQLEANSLTLSASIQAEKEKFESTIERYRSEKRRLVKQCEALQATLLLREAEAAKSKAAADQLQGAIATFNLQQRIGNSSS